VRIDTKGGDGGDANGGIGGAGDLGGSALGGGIWTDRFAILTIAPRQGAKKGSAQSRATNTITGNLANPGLGGSGGAGGSASAGGGGAPTGISGTAVTGTAGDAGGAGVGYGGGLSQGSSTNVRIDNTTIAGNHAATADDDVSGKVLK
jgi:hypothetical protein